MKKEKSWVSKLIVAILAVAMIVLVGFSFFKGTPPYTISDGIVYILCLLIVLLISDSVETFSIGSIFTLKKKVQEKETEVSKLSSENKDLRNQITTLVSTTLNNQNKNSTVIGIGGNLDGLFRVEPATAEDTRKMAEEHAVAGAQQQTVVTATNERNYTPYVRRQILEGIEKAVLDRFIKDNDIGSSGLQKEVKFSEQFIGCDPVMERQMIFDAYIRRVLDEIFVDILINPAMNAYEYRLYYEISKIYHYAAAKKTVAKLVLLVPMLPRQYHEKLYGDAGLYRDPHRNVERLKERFAPAIKNQLLEVVEVQLSEDECWNIVQNAEKA